MLVPLMSEIFSSDALLGDVLRTLLNVSMFSHSREVLSKQFQTKGPLNKYKRLSQVFFSRYVH